MNYTKYTRNNVSYNFTYTSVEGIFRLSYKGKKAAKKPNKAEDKVENLFSKTSYSFK